MGCWEWTASRDAKGYGKFNAPGFTLAHRFSYSLEHGALPDGLDVDHVCRNRACVRPDHLEAVTHWENLRRAREVRQLKTVCKNGHPFTDENTYYPPGGGRQCRACVRAAGHRYRKRTG